LGYCDPIPWEFPVTFLELCVDISSWHSVGKGRGRDIPSTETQRYAPTSADRPLGLTTTVTYTWLKVLSQNVFFFFQGSATVGLKSKTHAVIVALKVSHAYLKIVYKIFKICKVIIQ